MTKPNPGWFTLSIMACAFGAACGGSQASAPAASTANEVKEKSSGDGPGNPVSKHGSGTVQAKLGKGGGTLELDEGPRVSVPAGEVEGGQDFVLKIAPK